MANSAEYKSRVGLDSLHIAEVLQDDATDYLTGAVEWLAPAAEASAEPSVNRQTQFADDQPYDAMSAEGETSIKLKVTNVPLETLAKLTGRVYDAASGRLFDNAGTPGYFALMFRSKKSNGSYRYYCFLKGRFDMPAEEFASQTDSPEPKTIELTFTALKTVHAFDLGDIDDGVKRVVGDDDITAFSGTTWFDQVQTPVVGTPAALSLSSSTPAEGSSTLAVSANLVLVFSNVLAEGAENHVLLLDSLNEVVACAKSISTDRKTITLNPNSNLSAGAAYTIAAAVTDIYGQTLDVSVEFSTTS